MVRLGLGEGEQVADGRWARAVELPPPAAPPRGRRRRACGPQERLAALLGGRDAALACEELTLRARADLDRRPPARGGASSSASRSRPRCAELVPVGASAATSRARLDELRAARPAVERRGRRGARGRARRRADRRRRARVVGRLEAALRARSASA